MLLRTAAAAAVSSVFALTPVSLRREQSLPTRWVLVYAGSAKGGHPSYSVTDFRQMLISSDSASSGRWVCTGTIFVHLYAASGRAFATWIGGLPADGGDWTTYLDSLFAPNGALARLDSAVAISETTAGDIRGKFPFSLMIPYPDPKSDSLLFAGRRYDLKTAAGRVGAVEAYTRSARDRDSKVALPHLRFDGFYWLMENAPPEDTAVVKQVAQVVHAAGLRFLWIPYFTARNQEVWRNLGFDEAWLQPNYFFNRDVPATRLDSAAARAARMGMGLEIEFDGRLLSDARYSDRLDPYLATLALHTDLRSHSTVLYEGGGSLIALSRSADPALRARYANLVRVLQ